MRRSRVRVGALILAVILAVWVGNATNAAPGQGAPGDDTAAVLQAELATHPSWPQRSITIDATDSFLRLPYGTGDPPDYLDWLDQLGVRYDGAVRRVFTPDVGAPSLAELEQIQKDIFADLQRANVRISYMLPFDLAKGRVEFKHAPTKDDVVLSLIAREQQLYGSLFFAEDISALPEATSTMVTKGGYGTVGSDSSGHGHNCTLGFNVVKNGVYHFLTAGHRAQGGGFSGVATSPYFYSWTGGTDPWFQSSDTYFGQNAASLIVPPDGDMAVIRYSPTNTITKYGAVYYGTGTVDLIALSSPFTNDWACSFGARTLSNAFGIGIQSSAVLGGSDTFFDWASQAKSRWGVDAY